MISNTAHFPCFGSFDLNLSRKFSHKLVLLRMIFKLIAVLTADRTSPKDQ